MTDDEIIAIKKSIKFNPSVPWSESLAFAKAVLAAQTDEASSLLREWFDASIDGIGRDELIRQTKRFLEKKRT